MTEPGLTEWLLTQIETDRIGDEERLIASFMDTGAPVEVIQARLRKSLAWARVGVRHDLRVLGLSIVAALPGIGTPWLRSLASPYSGRPGFREEWRTSDTPTS